MTAGAWGCPHELNDRCVKIKGRPCVPGMKGCVLYGLQKTEDGEDRVPEDRVPEDRVPEDRVPEDRVPEDRVPEDRRQISLRR
ncbi:MAG: hypothetical protein LBD06_11455, partial [Candidatus Accumulibacter sp.]|nr:hypothetical protein [Accumulibacter sp.]